MPKNNGYMEDAIPAFYRAQTFDVMLYMFVFTTRHHLPSITIQEAVKAFQGQFNVSPELIDVEVCVQIYYRLSERLKDSERSKNAKKEGS